MACEILIHIYHASQGSVRDQVFRDLSVLIRALKKLSLANPLLGKTDRLSDSFKLY